MLNYLYLLQVTDGLAFQEANLGQILVNEKTENYFYQGEELFDKNLEILL